MPRGAVHVVCMTAYACASLCFHCVLSLCMVCSRGSHGGTRRKKQQVFAKGRAEGERSSRRMTLIPLVPSRPTRDLKPPGGKLGTEVTKRRRRARTVGDASTRASRTHCSCGKSSLSPVIAVTPTSTSAAVHSIDPPKQRSSSFGVSVARDVTAITSLMPLRIASIACSTPSVAMYLHQLTTARSRPSASSNRKSRSTPDVAPPGAMV
mmetsp:Transcript_42124/g.91518  ORF Transcript_42124/g.91518 Transcript_42124/m.91518 type:complete len:208 (+) Transcript_42124:136-759(+)